MSFAAAFSTQNSLQPFSGVVSVRRDGAAVFAQAGGLAYRPAVVPNTLDTRFGMASGAKTFTAVAICQLVDQGLLSFDTRLEDCLELRFPHFDPAITIHHLLSHTSGIPDYFEEEIEENYEALWENRPMYRFRAPVDFLPLFQDQPMKFAPGQRWAYSNAGYILLGLVLERLAGRPFTDTIVERIFNPAGMLASGYFRLDALPERTAVGYIQEPEGAYRANLYAIPIVGGPDGGAFTTLEDIGRFWQALRSGRLLSQAALERMLFPHCQRSPDQPAGWYGYGLWINRRADGAIHFWRMLGEDPGCAFTSMVYPAQGVELTLMGNLVPGAWAMNSALRRLIEE